MFIILICYKQNYDWLSIIIKSYLEMYSIFHSRSQHLENLMCLYNRHFWMWPHWTNWKLNQRSNWNSVNIKHIKLSHGKKVTNLFLPLFVLELRLNLCLQQQLKVLPLASCNWKLLEIKLYSWNKITTTWIQISHQNWNGFFSNASQNRRNGFDAKVGLM